MNQDSRKRIADIIADYRYGQISTPDASHVDRWVSQFPAAAREPIVDEMTHVLAKSYVSQDKVQHFLRVVASSEKIAGKDPATFWRGVRFLRLQQAGNSQRDMLALFDHILNDLFGFTTKECGVTPTRYVYLDDGVFSGGRIKSDLVRWIENDAPKDTSVAVVVMALHTGGHYYAKTSVAKATLSVGKTVEITWWRGMEVEDRKAYTDNSDVLRPATIPFEAKAYIDSLEYAPVLRRQNHVGPLGFFSSGDGRNHLEQEFLKAGVLVRERCTNLPAQMRPLGATWLQTPGFGTMFVTYRNIANNAPLVLWAGNPWYPLFPRRTN